MYWQWLSTFGVVETLDELVSIYRLPELTLGTWKCTFLFSDVRDVLQCTMITHQILLRGAAQCYLLQTAMNLVDVVSWSFTQDTSVYESFSVNKCAKTCQWSRGSVTNFPGRQQFTRRDSLLLAELNLSWVSDSPGTGPMEAFAWFPLYFFCTSSQKLIFKKSVVSFVFYRAPLLLLLGIGVSKLLWRARKVLFKFVVSVIIT